MKKRIRYQLLSGILSLCLAGSQMVIPSLTVYADQPAVICPHHVHDEACGYSEGTPCNHEHTEDCYTLVEACVHEHTAECYPESETGDAATPSNAAEPTECSHVCSEETGCITKELNCQHEHDDECGYSEGTPCGYVCEICNADEGKIATPSNANYTITAWDYIDEKDYLTEANGGYAVALGGMESPLAKDELVEGCLPAAITATVDGVDGEQTIALSGWDCADYPETEAPTGSYTFTAVLPDGYTLADDAAALNVTVSFGETMLTAKKPTYSGGSGTQSDPYLISSVTDLQTLASTVNDGSAADLDADCTSVGNYHGYYFKQTCDLDLSSINSWDPIGYSGGYYFAGNYDGGGYTISGMTSTGKNDDDGFATAGLFGWVAFGSVTDVHIEDANLKATGKGNYSYAGGIAGVVYGSSVTDCSVKDSSIESIRTDNNNCAGGIAGFSTGGTFNRCSVENAKVKTMAYGGGFVGEIDDDNNGAGTSSFTSCFVADSSVTAYTSDGQGVSFAGGFAGELTAAALTIENCFVYNTSAIIGENSAPPTLKATGVFAGHQWQDETDSPIDATNCYFYTKEESPEKFGTATSKTAKKFASGEVCDLLGNEFGQSIGTDKYPVFETDSNTVYQVTDCQGNTIYSNTNESGQHSYGNWQNDAGGHWKTCSLCNTSTKKVAHSGGTATYTKQATCEVCGAKYGNILVAVDMSGITLENKSYDGKGITYTGAASGGSGYTGGFTYEWYDSTGTKLTEAPKDAGTYTLKAIATDTGYASTGEKTVTISPATLTVKALDKSAIVGDSEPSLANPVENTDYTVTGLATGESLTTAPTLSYESTPDMSAARTYAIKASGADAGSNYTIQYEDGKLTIAKRSYNVTVSAGTGGTASASATTATEGTTITLTATTNSGYKFSGWISSDVTITGASNETATFTMPEGNVTVTASWTKNSSSGGSTSGGSTSGGSGESSSSSQSGTTTKDPVKGYVNSVSGIVTGSGSGYSSWVYDSTGWWLKYADGSYAKGNITTDAAGKQIEIPHWEFINGKWFAFGASGYIRTGWLYDPVYKHLFYIDVNRGMLTGWQLLNNKWYYFNPVSDGTRGRLFVNTTTPDGYKVGADGAWIQ